MRTLIRGGNIVNEGRCFEGSVLIEDDLIVSVKEGIVQSLGIHDEEVDARGCFVLPGVIDSHVHFRQPGLTEKADIDSESRAAAYGGVTTFFDMPNTIPLTTTLSALKEKFELGNRHSHVNYSFFFGATNDNGDAIRHLDHHRIPGIKLFMGASTGNMLVDGRAALSSVFESASEMGLPLMAHCEDTPTINENLQKIRQRYGDDPDVQFHPLIRSEEACVKSSSFALDLAREYGTQLHIAHVSTAKELEMIAKEGSPHVTMEATVAHLLFSDNDYLKKGTLIKCNPAVKTSYDRDMIRQAAANGLVTTIATDHAPHLLSQKEGGCVKAASGMPMVQFSLPAMLGLVDEGVFSIERMVELMAHNPARLFKVRDRGFIRRGNRADIAIVRPNSPWTVTKDIVQSKCQWSPLLGHTFNWKVTHTLCNGHIVYREGSFDEKYRGEEVVFR